MPKGSKWQLQNLPLSLFGTEAHHLFKLHSQGACPRGWLEVQAVGRLENLVCSSAWKREEQAGQGPEVGSWTGLQGAQSQEVDVKEGHPRPPRY